MMILMMIERAILWIFSRLRLRLYSGLDAVHFMTTTRATISMMIGGIGNETIVALDHLSYEEWKQVFQY